MDIALTLSYDELKDQEIIYSRLMALDEKDKLVLIKIELSDAYVIMGLRNLIFHIFLWNIYFSFNIDVTSKHVFDRPRINDGEMSKLHTKILMEIRESHPMDNNRDKISDVFFRYINELYNFIAVELNKCVTTLDYVSLLKLLEHPKIKPVRKVKYNEMFGTQTVERQIAQAGERVLELLSDEKEIPIKDNCLYWSVQTDQINPLQLTQMMVAYGPRTDIDDMIVSYPIMENAIEGLRTVSDMVVESLASKKSAVYNLVSVSTSQYLNRKEQLTCTAVSKIYPDDCGTNVTLNYTINESTKHTLLGMNMLKDGQVVKLNNKVLGELKHKEVIKLFNPITCKHTDGVCYKCGGDILKNFNPHVHLGIVVASLIIQRITQKILSNKHHNKTVTLSYEILPDAEPYIRNVNASNMGWTDNIKPKLKHMRMGIHVEDIPEINWITSIDYTQDERYSRSGVELLEIKKKRIREKKERNGLKHIKEEKYTKLKKVILKDMDTHETIVIPLVSTSGICPFLTFEMLLHTSNYLNSIGDTNYDDNGYIWIPLKGTEDFTVFGTLAINDAINRYVKSIQNFLEQRAKNKAPKDLYVADCTTVNAALSRFVRMVHSREKNVHVSLLSIMLKAYLVTDKYNYQIPEVTDPDNVAFQTTQDLISRRSVSTELAFEGLFKYLQRPDSYLYPKNHSVLDPFFGILDE